MLDLEGWPLQPDKCRCDEDFIEWLISKPKPLPTAGVFHMGPGLHHRVGIYCAEEGTTCLSVTASNEEWRAFAKWRIENPNSSYTCIEGNVNSMVIRPAFSIMSLFHFGEMPDRYGEIDEKLLARLVLRVYKEGEVLFYTGSSAWDRASVAVAKVVEAGLLTLTDKYKALEIYTR
jgi:hypothetical protein